MLRALVISEALSFSSVSSFDFLVVKLLKLSFLESPEDDEDLIEALELLLSESDDRDMIEFLLFDAWDMTEFLLDVD